MVLKRCLVCNFRPRGIVTSINPLFITVDVTLYMKLWTSIDIALDILGALKYKNCYVVGNSY